jgi:hypothetical protein
MSAALFEKIETLNRRVWENRLNKQMIDGWLANFTGLAVDDQKERLHALFLLSHFMYFGHRQIRQLIKAMFRDSFKYPIVEHIRQSNGDTKDHIFLEKKFLEHVAKTRFIGLGNPSESGCHVLYYFRQMNGLPKDIFVQGHELLGATPVPGFPGPEHFVFIDDFCGSGETALKARALVETLRRMHPTSKIDHLMLFGCEAGIQMLRAAGIFDRIEAVIELDASFRCFGTASRYFNTTPDEVEAATARRTCEAYGNFLVPSAPLGFNDCQLLLSFHHNTPDNTLPIFWAGPFENAKWSPLFPRYPKLAYNA